MAKENEKASPFAIGNGYTEVSSDFFVFKNEGDQVQGTLIQVSKMFIRQKEVGKYTVFADGRRISFLGTVQLDSLLEGVKTGTAILIIFQSWAITSAGNKVKQFKVYVKES